MKPDNLLTSLWYYVCPAHELKKGTTARKIFLGEPIVFGRKADGTPFALRDICPHQGVPLSDGCFDGNTLECCFHGWKFDSTGTCTEIPSLVSAQSFDCATVKVKNYPCQIAQGNVWVFIGEPNGSLPELPKIPGVGESGYSMTATTLELPSHIDFGVIALMDPAHVPYVHNSWWFRSPKTMKEKSKYFVPSEMGYKMAAHTASTSSPIYKVLGGIPETEIRFQLPSIRIEHMTIKGKTVFTGVTSLTPIDETHTQICHVMYWPIWWMRLFKPFIQRVSDSFLAQDVAIAAKQQVGLKSNPQLMMIIKDAGTPVKWYFDLKKEWNTSTEEKRAFANPVEEATLQWRS